MDYMHPTCAWDTGAVHQPLFWTLFSTRGLQGTNGQRKLSHGRQTGCTLDQAFRVKVRKPIGKLEPQGHREAIRGAVCWQPPKVVQGASKHDEVCIVTGAATPGLCSGQHVHLPVCLKLQCASHMPDRLKSLGSRREQGLHAD